jgi:hypothetical protein
MKLAISLLALWSLITVGCADGEGDIPVSTPTTVNGALNNVGTQVDNLVPNTESVAATAFFNRAAMTTEWTTTNLNQYSLGGDFGNSPRDFVRVMGDGDSQSSLMMRLNQILENVCVFNVALTDDNNDGIPDLTDGSNTTLTAAVKAEMVSTCNADPAQLPPDDTVVGYQVQATEDGSDYEYIIGFDLMGGINYTSFFSFTINETINRFSYMENSTNQSIALFEFVPATNLFRFEFSEYADMSFEAHYRGILDGNTGLGRFVAAVTNNTDTSTAVVSVQEGGGDELHVSYSFDDDADADDFDDGSACINSSDFSIATDNTETCGSITGALVSGFTFDWQTTITPAWITSRGVNANIQFTNITDILTAPAAD